MSYTGAVKNDGIKPVSFILGGATQADLPYLAYKVDTTKENTLLIAGATDADDVVGFGTEQVPVKAGEHIAVKCDGFVLANAGGSITVGAEIGLAANGKVVAITTGKSIGMAISPAANNEYVQIKLYGVVKTLV